MTTTLTRRWDVMNSLSCASFAVRNLGLKTVHGQVPISAAWAEVDGRGRPVGIRATLDLAAIATGNARRDRDLAMPKLLDTGRFPTIVFDGRAGEPDEAGWRLTGRLEAHGSSIDVVLAAVVTAAPDEVHVHASTSFDRRDLGITAPRLLIGSWIAVTIDAVLRPAAEA